MNWNRLNARSVRAIAAALTCAIVLAACGREQETTPTATPAPSATALLDLTPQTTTTEAAATVATQTPSTPVPAASPAAGDPSVGELADRIAAAWTGVTSYRTTFTTTESAPTGTPGAGSGASPAAMPVAGVVERIVVDEVIVPGQRRRTESVGGRIVSEIVLVNGAVYLRGIAPEGTPVADPNAWVTLDANLPADSPYRALYDEITAPPAPPYASLSQDERERTAHPTGETAAGGRTCTAYQIADTSNTGERIDVVIALGADDLPCSIETRAGATTGTTVFEFNLPLTIAPPQ